MLDILILGSQLKNYGKAGDVSLQSVEFYEYPHNEALCPVVTLVRYIKVTQQLRMSPRLFLVSINLTLEL